MIETVEVAERSNLIVSQKTQRTYFTIQDAGGRKLLCFDKGLYNEMPVGTIVQLDVAPAKGDQTPTFKRPPKEAPATEEAQAATAEPSPPDDMPYPKHPLTYAVDYWSAKIAMGTECKINDVLEAAEIFRGYMKGEIKPDITRIIAALMKPAQKELKKEE